MSDRLEHARRLGERIDARWAREDVEAQLTRLHARRRSRALRRIAAVPLAVAAMVAIGAAMWLRPAEPVVMREVVAPPAPMAPVAAPAAVPARAVVADEVRPPSEPPRERVRVIVPPAPSASDEAVAPSPSWIDDAGRGDYAAAWVKLEHVAPLERMADLLLAGDVARLSSHPGAAIAPLARAVELHPADPRAPLAAFTRGRVHLEELGAPREAAEAFAQARALAPGGPLAEDALAREVEAWSRAGETETARARARTYLERYPQGRRTHAVRRFGGLEAP